METLSQKIDFAAILLVKNANPNGDPLNGNRPRTTYDGFGEISDVCLKRKIRNRLQAFGIPIFVQSDDNRVDEYSSLRARAEGELSHVPKGDEKAFRKESCGKWIDVRAFGQLFAFTGDKKKGKGKAKDSEDETEQSESVSIGIRGPVSIHSAYSVGPVNTTSIQITKSVSGQGDGKKRDSDTMGMKHRIDHGVYATYGSMNPQLATATGFSDDDAASIKRALVTLFENDASSARPEGSMEVVKVYWWKHKNKNGQFSSAKVHRSLEISVKGGITEPHSIDDYEIQLTPLEGLDVEIIEGR